ncbi:MAG TPA: hypothetical protein VNT26_15355, partial [Candidatus Sulfotelmatobacter sp.]|nr:hypothetical protein [Candidatus Sulfotelmatobacter sp.]
LADAQHQGGPEYAYRLRLSPPQPDFELRVAPSSVTLRGGVSVPLTVYALRKDGFTNEIVLALDQAPPGFSLSGGRIPANQDQVRVTVSSSSFASKEPVSVSLEGRAFIQGRPVAHRAVPAEDMMQAFAYRHLVPAQELKVAVVGRWAGRSTVRLLGDTPVKIPAGGTVRVPITGPFGLFENRVQLELSEAPEGITLEKVESSRDGTEIVLRTDSAKVKPGLKGNLIVNAFATRAAGAGKAKAQNNRQRTLFGTLPAIPFEVVAQ